MRCSRQFSFRARVLSQFWRLKNGSGRRWVLATIAISVLVAVGLYGFLYYWTHRFDLLIIEEAKAQELDPMLVKSLIFEESFFNPRARSEADARGLMQVTPIVIKEWATRKGYSDGQSALTKEFR